MADPDNTADTILFVGTYPPRECGIATFTKDLSDAVEKKFSPQLKVRILAMNNNGVNIYNYPKKVIMQLSDNIRKDYVKAAKKINRNKHIGIISIQHEFGIFGGEYGEYLTDFLKEVKKPIIVTFHSVLPDPDEKRIEVVRDIAENVEEIVVMTPKGSEILKDKYGLTTPIRVIPHGIPTVSYESQTKAKKHFGLKDKTIISSFGMVNKGKGYEYVIESLPEVVKQYPNLVYLIVGATHPVVRRQEGEEYRNMLSKKVKDLGLEDNVKFYNKYTTLKEIIEYLKATDIYMSTTLTPEQITSGTLVYAMGCGRATISTPFLHARDLITPHRGVLVNKFRNSRVYTKALLNLLSDMKSLKDMEKDSYAFTRQMTWPNVALAYGESIKKAVYMPEIFFEQLPRLKTKHITRMTDDFGMIQFANYTKPDIASGYTLDDNARALIVAGKLYNKSRNSRYLEFIQTYLNYIEYSQEADGRLYNLVSKDKVIDRNSFSEEAHGRAIGALGFITSLQTLPQETRAKAERILVKSIPVAELTAAPRAISSIISGLYYYNKEKYSPENINLIKDFAGRLLNMHEENSTEGWEWFEPILTYSNAKISRALLHAYIATQDKKYLEVAETSLKFLIKEHFKDNIFVPIGQNGWYEKDKPRSDFDQQPLDATSMVETLALAYQITKNPNYERKAITTFNWFLGRNTLNQVIYNEQTGGCHDGLGKNCINLNQGAESTLAYLHARLTLPEIA